MSNIPPTTHALAVRYVPWVITTPAGTTQAAPLVTNAPESNAVLISAHLRVPPGHWGLTGFRLDYSGFSILPFANPAQFLIGDDDSYDFEIGFEIGVGLQAVTYNVDVFDHSHYLLLKMTDLGRAAPQGVRFVDITAG